MKETLNEIQRHLQRLDNRISSHDAELTNLSNGQGPGAPPGGALLLQEVEQRVQESCAACLAGSEGLRRQQAEDRERMRGLEKLISSVDQRNREAVESIQRHVSGLAGRLPKDCCSPLDELRGRVADLERGLDRVSGSFTMLNARLDQELAGLEPAGAGQGGRVLAARLVELEGRLNATQRGLQEHPLPGHLAGELGRRLSGAEGELANVASQLSGFQGHVQRALANLSHAVETLKGSVQLSSSRDGLAGSVRALATDPTAKEQARLEQVEAELRALSGAVRAQERGCSQACAALQEEVGRLRGEVAGCTGACPLLPRQPEQGREPVETPKPLDGFSVFGGTSAVDLKSLQGELSEVILSFSSLNDTLRGLQSTVDKHQTDLLELGSTKDRIIAEINKVQAEATERAAEGEERLEGVTRRLQQLGGSLRGEAGECRRAAGGLEQRLAKLEGVCERLDGVSGSLRAVKEGLSRHVTGLWGCLQEVNGTLRTHGALLTKLDARLGTTHPRLGALNASLLHLQGAVHNLTRQDLAGRAPAPREQPPQPRYPPPHSPISPPPHCTAPPSPSTPP
uniref:Elastin microfibril interfacer 1 n=1 Tax=Chelydra serpentina TaxID=8475 RepID=A0A8C3S973_CHESE